MSESPAPLAGVNVPDADAALVVTGSQHEGCCVGHALHIFPAQVEGAMGCAVPHVRARCKILMVSSCAGS